MYRAIKGRKNDSVPRHGGSQLREVREREVGTTVTWRSSSLSSNGASSIGSHTSLGGGLRVVFATCPGWMGVSEGTMYSDTPTASHCSWVK